MKVRNLESKKIVELDENRVMDLEYYLTEEISEDKNSIYGIQIIKRDGGVVEKEEVDKLSFSKDIVISILKKLSSNVITPVVMLEVIDELVTDYISC